MLAGRSAGDGLGVALHDRRKVRDLLAHDLASLEFHGRARWDHKAAARLVRIPADPRFREFHFEHAEVSEFDGVAIGESVVM
jgi:hypothetical protein